MPKKIKVMLVDDSAVVRQVLQAVLDQDPDIEVIGAASDPIFALHKLQQQWPDVIVSDIEMPRMDGITFLKHIMSEHPTPVVICSSLTEKNAELTMSALASGAVGVITKPKIGVKNFLKASSDDLISAVKGAANANIKMIKKNAEILESVPPKHTADAVLSAVTNPLKQTTDHVVVIGTSTGGTQALEVVLRALPRVCTGIVVVQHMPEKFTASFAARLDSLCELEVKEAENNDRVMPGRVLIAPGGRHMVLKRNGARYHVEIIDGPLVNRHKPSVDVLFRSAAKYAGKNALGIIMTGMGDDGAKGLHEMRMAGATTIAQDEKTCVVYGMPREAVKLGAVEKILPLDHIANAIKEF